MINLKFKKLDNNAVIPEYKSVGAAGFDFHAIIDENNKFFVSTGECSIYDTKEIKTQAVEDCLCVPSKEQCIVKTGLSVEVPCGFELQIRPRSGLSFKHSITLTNAVGTIDSDYRGEIMIILYNLGKDDFVINLGDRVAQGIISEVPKVNIKEVEELSSTDRGSGAFGSTGK